MNPHFRKGKLGTRVLIPIHPHPPPHIPGADCGALTSIANSRSILPRPAIKTSRSSLRSKTKVSWFGANSALDPSSSIDLCFYPRHPFWPQTVNTKRKPGQGKTQQAPTDPSNCSPPPGSAKCRCLVERAGARL